MLLAEVVATSAAVAATRSRKAKVAALAATIAALPRDEVTAGTAFLAGRTRQGRIGVGWRTLQPLAEASPAGDPSLTVGGLDRALAALANLSGPGSVAARSALLADLFARATAPEQDFLRRLLLGDLRQGALEGVVADAVAAAFAVEVGLVRRAAMLAGDLPLVAAVAAADGAPGLEAIGLRPLCPVQPMLASTAASVAEALELVGGTASVEWKLDGARIQAHRDGDDVRLFTRNLNDVTARLAGVVDVVRRIPATSLVLDGEVLGVDVDAERPDRFQDTMSRFGRHDGSGDVLVVRFFDCLHVDGSDLLDRPFVDRLSALAELLPPEHRVPGRVTADVDEAAAVLDEALDHGHEGVMVKAAGSPYDAGRRGGSWRKVKPVRTLDLVVLGAEWGYGRRQGWLSNLHLGARGDDGGFVMVGKTFKGLTDELLRWQTERFLELEASRFAGGVHVRPELVVEIALDGVQASTRYAAGVTLRFARVKRYRPDKTAAQADTIDAVRALL
jgi:DNA ligase-1